MRRTRILSIGVCTLLAGATALAATEARASSCEGWQQAHGPEDDCGEPSQPICFPVFGVFEAESVLPPECASPVGLCTEGDLYGFLKGTYALTLEQIVPVDDPRVPFMSFFVGTSEIDSNYFGDLVGVDTGALNMLPPGTFGSGEFVTQLSLVEGGHGWVKIRGQLDFVTGEVTGSYVGAICPE